MVLDTTTVKRLEDLLQQQANAICFVRGKLPSSRLLLAGHPGSGKTMTAPVLAGELHLPLF